MLLRQQTRSMPTSLWLLAAVVVLAVMVAQQEVVLVDTVN